MQRKGETSKYSLWTWLAVRNAPLPFRTQLAVVGLAPPSLWPLLNCLAFEKQADWSCVVLDCVPGDSTCV